MRAIKIIILGYLALFGVGFLVVNVFDVHVKQMGALNMIDTLTWYRNAFYLLVIAAWPTISIYLAKKREQAKCNFEARVFINDSAERQYFNELKAQTAFEVEYLKSAWWKVALFFVIFEVMAVQKLWF